jgi:UPF0755 protein
VSGGYGRWDDGQDAGDQSRDSRRRLRGRTDQHAPPRADDAYGYDSAGYGSTDDQAGPDGYGRGYGGDGYQAHGGYPGDNYPTADYFAASPSGYRNGYGQDGYDQDTSGQGGYDQDGYGQDSPGQNGYGQDSYGGGGYADDGYGGAGYRENGYRGGGDYADNGYGRDAGYDAQDRYQASDGPYSSRDSYSAADPYRAQDPYDGGDQYDSADPYASGDSRDSGQHGRTDPRGLTDPRNSTDPRGMTDPRGSTDPRGMTDPRGPSDPYRGGRDAYESAGVSAYGGQDDYGDAPAGYRGQDDYGDATGYRGQDDYGDAAGYRGQDDYGDAAGYGAQDDYGQPGAYGGSPTGYEPGGGYGAQDERLGWPDPADRRNGPDTGQSRRSAAGVSDPDVSRHEGFFRGFGQDDDFGGGGGRGSRKGGKPPKERKSHAGLIALVVVLVIIGGIGSVGYHYYTAYKSRHASYTGSGFGTVDVFVKSGDTPDSIAGQLFSKHVIESIDPWAAYVANKSGLQPGEFKLHEHMSPAAAWALLISPKSKVNSTVTIPDGLPLSKILPLLAKGSGLPLSQFESASKDIAALGLPSFANGSLEGFLYPDTYDIVPGSTTALQILQDAVSQFNKEVTSLNLAAAAQQAQFTELQVITEASLLEAEVGPQYYADVARVIDNRLNLGMDLQLDSTVAYATGDYNYNFTESQLQVNSPYNTFIHSDLPPGPIDAPDAAAIQAVLSPAPSSDDWLYFVTVNKAGLTEFTDSNSQFQTWSQEAKQNGV